jgi:nitrogen fixation protein FixH
VERPEQPDPTDRSAEKTKENPSMTQPAKKGGVRWQLGIALLIAVFLVGMTASMMAAARRASRVVDVDYYSHGLHYGDTQNPAKNAGLGWSMAAALSGNELQVQVKDKSGAPVPGGKLSFQPRENARGQVATALELAESAPGVFRVERPAAARGELHGTLRYRRGEAIATQKLVLLN